MALEFTSWQDDGGKGQTKISSIRSDQKDFFSNSNAWIEQQKKNLDCVLITKDRTDHQSPIQHIVWQRPGYIDPVNE